MTKITKTKDAYASRTVFSGKSRFWYERTGQSWTTNWGDTFITSFPPETIHYDAGPKYIRSYSGKLHCNWKSCIHTGRFIPFPAVEGYHYTMHAGNPRAISREDTMSGFRPAQWSDFTFPTPPSLPSPDLYDLANRMWDDLAGRANSAFLALEDLAGFISGKSLWQGIRGIAAASSMVSRSIRNANKLRRAFGRKATIYDCWTSAKELVRQLIGGDLAYRFSFKTTLNDICRSFELANQFHAYANRILNRNLGGYLHYTKSISDDNEAKLVYTSDDVRRRMFYAGGNPRSFFMPPSGSELPPVTCTTSSRVRLTVHAWARVRYPDSYRKLGHYISSSLGFDKPLSTVWAIMPLSFVIDYLLRVQDTLEYVDNRLNDSSVVVDIRNAWCLKHTFVEERLQIPEKSWYWEGTPDFEGRRDKHTLTWPAVNVAKRYDQVFERFPYPITGLMSQLPPLIRADEQGWLQRIGTGFELLSQRRLK